jgi:hypothetical protein
LAQPVCRSRQSGDGGPAVRVRARRSLALADGCSRRAGSWAAQAALGTDGAGHAAHVLQRGVLERKGLQARATDASRACRFHAAARARAGSSRTSTLECSHRARPLPSAVREEEDGRYPVATSRLEQVAAGIPSRLDTRVRGGVFALLIICLSGERKRSQDTLCWLSRLPGGCLAEPIC